MGQNPYSGTHFSVAFIVSISINSLQAELLDLSDGMRVERS
jgi:hypothetical protein